MFANKNSKVYFQNTEIKKIYLGDNLIWQRDVWDTDVATFISKSGITSDIEKNALNTCVKALKSEGLYTKIKVFYPMVGGTSNTTKYDLISTNNNAYNIDWYGGVTFSNLGVKGNGTNAYGNSKYVPSSSNAFTVSIGTNISETASDPIVLGVFDSTTQAFLMQIKGVNCNVRLHGDIKTASIVSSNNIYTFNRVVNLMNVFFNTSKKLEVTTNGTIPTNSIYLLNMNIKNAPSNSRYSQQRIQSTLFHESLTDTEVITLQTIINQFESDLGRKTW